MFVKRSVGGHHIAFRIARAVALFALVVGVLIALVIWLLPRVP